MEDFMTMEKLMDRISPTYGAVIKYGSKVFITGVTYRGDYTARVYNFIETPEEIGVSEIECRLELWAEAKDRFVDSGHAIEWCFKQI